MTETVVSGTPDAVTSGAGNGGPTPAGSGGTGKTYFRGRKYRNRGTGYKNGYDTNREFSRNGTGGSKKSAKAEAVGGSFDFVDKRMAADLFDDTKNKLITYFEQEYEEGADVKKALMAGRHITFTDPAVPSDLTTNKAAELIWKADLDAVRKRKEWYRKNMTSAFAVILAVCSETLQSTLENTPGFETLDMNSDALGLLNMIKQVMFTQKERKDPMLALVEARAHLVGLKQFDMTVQKYYDVFVQNAEVLRLCGGCIGISSDAVTARLTEKGNKNPSGQEILDMINSMEQECMAGMLIHGADDKRFGILKEELANDYSKGQDNYPKTLAKARTMLATRSDKALTYVRGRENQVRSEVAFATSGQENTKKKKNLEHITCFSCGKKGHYANTTDCPNFQGDTTTASDKNEKESKAPVSGEKSAVQLLLDAAEEDEYDDVSYDYGDMFVTMAEESTNEACEESEDEGGYVMGACENCGSQGIMGLLCRQCEDQGFIYANTITKEDDNEPREQREMGTCDNCNHEGRVGRKCSECKVSWYRSKYGWCAVCKRDGPLEEGCISCQEGVYEAVYDHNHGYVDIRKAPEGTIPWRVPDADKVVGHEIGEIFDDDTGPSFTFINSKEEEETHGLRSF